MKEFYDLYLSSIHCLVDEYKEYFYAISIMLIIMLIIGVVLLFCEFCRCLAVYHADCNVLQAFFTIVRDDIIAIK